MLRSWFHKRIIFLCIACIFFQSELNAEVVKIDNVIQNFVYVPITKIPNGPKPKLGQYQCKYFVIEEDKLKSPEAKMIKNLGWEVLSETKFANYTLVAFAGEFIDGTSSTCMISQSNIAIYSDEDLLGLIYLNSPEATQIGKLVLSDAGYIRIFSGGYIQLPNVEIHLKEHGLVLTHQSNFTPYCNGASILPNVIGLDILKARELLFKYGFKPSNLADQSIPAWRENLLDEGIFEVDSCSGTGFAFCRFNYSNDISSVGLITAGEDEIPTVVRDDVNFES